jgi:hypothetical protein
MQKRSPFLALTAVALLWGFGALEARAGNVPLPATLDQFVNADGSSNGNFTTVQQPNELDTFSGFSYSTSPVDSPPSPANITVSAFLPPLTTESGLTFTGAFAALPGTVVAYALSYTVAAPPGFLISDAGLSAAMATNGGNGAVAIVELLNYPNNTSDSLTVSLPGPDSASIQFPAVSSILVQDHIFLSGGSQGANVNFLNQGFSSAIVAEPTSMISLSIGSMAIALWAFRRRFKRSLVNRERRAHA